MLAVKRCTMSFALTVAFASLPAAAQSSESSDAEISALKRQVQALEEKLDKLQKRRDARIAVAPKATAKPDAPNVYAAIPVKGPAAQPEAIVTMPNNRPTICTAQNRARPP
jgi:phosphate-selective porin OprO and OprP